MTSLILSTLPSEPSIPLPKALLVLAVLLFSILVQVLHLSGLTAVPFDDNPTATSICSRHSI